MAESFKYIEVLCDVGASLASLSKDYPIRFEDAPPIFELSNTKLPSSETLMNLCLIAVSA